MARKFVSLVVLAAVVAGLAACNTVKGAGKDLEEAGEAIQGED